MVQTKARSGRFIAPFEVTIRDGEDGAVHIEAADGPKPAVKKLDEFENVVCVQVLDCVRANPGASLRLLAEKCHRRPGTVGAALEQLERHGAVKNAGNDKNGKWFGC